MTFEVNADSFRQGPPAEGSAWWDGPVFAFFPSPFLCFPPLIRRRGNGYGLGMIRALFFDFNGVPLDDEEVPFELFREILGQEGIAMSARQYHEQFLGLDDRGCFEAALIEAGRVADTP